MKLIPKLQKAQLPIVRQDAIQSFVPRERINPIPLTPEQQQNMRMYGQLNRPKQVTQVLSQGKKKTPEQQKEADARVESRGKIEAYVKQKAIDDENERKALQLLPYAIPYVGEAMLAGKAIDLATNKLSGNKYESWGDMLDKNVGGSHSTIDKFAADLTNPGYYAGTIAKLATPLIKSGVEATSKELLRRAEPYVFGEKQLPFNIRPVNYAVDASGKPTSNLVTKQKQIWELNGVKSDLPDDEISDMIAYRKNEIKRTAPQTYMVDEPLTHSRSGQITLYTKPGNKTYDVGYLNYEKPSFLEPEYNRIEFIENTAADRVKDKISVSTPLYQGLLQRSKDEGLQGFLSGRSLLKPEKTVKNITESFHSTPSSKITGTRSYAIEDTNQYIRDAATPDEELSRMEQVKDEDLYNAKNEFRPSVGGYPIFRVNGTKVPQQFPIKSVLSATPNEGLDWSNPNVFKTILGIIGTGTVGYGVSQKKKGGLIRKNQNGNILENIYKQYPAFRNVETPVLKADPNYTREKSGMGDIETFMPTIKYDNNSIHYPNGFVLNNPAPEGHAGIVYNPKTNGETAIKLDMLHLMHGDPTYQKHWTEFRDAYIKSNLGDNPKKSWLKWSKENPHNDGYEAFEANMIDGNLRNLILDPNNSSDKKLMNPNIPGHYYDKAREEVAQNPEVLKRWLQIKNYLETSNNKSYMLPEVTVTAKKPIR